MSEARSVSAEVEVAVDAPTAFSAFTEEMDLWWVRGPINFFDASRAVAMTCEPGVGGRILEVYDEAAGDALELGRITVCSRASGCAGKARSTMSSSTSGSDPTDGGTIVRVSATIPATAPSAAARSGCG